MEQTKRELYQAALELAQEEERARQERIKVEKLLDQWDLERLEWRRLKEDMYPGVVKPEQEDE